MTKEEEIYALIGEIVASWNYTERCARQILRQQVPGGRLDDDYHLGISILMPVRIEDRLKRKVLPKWRGEPGESALKSLVGAFSKAKDYRNYYVHGFSGVTPGPDPHALISQSKPHGGKLVATAQIPVAVLRAYLSHLGELGHYAQEVMVGYDTKGRPARDSDGTLVVQKPRTPIIALPALQMPVINLPPPPPPPPPPP